jgi:hypothetical protein
MRFEAKIVSKKLKSPKVLKKNLQARNLIKIHTMFPQITKFDFIEYTSIELMSAIVPIIFQGCCYNSLRVNIIYPEIADTRIANSLNIQ